MNIEKVLVASNERLERLKKIKSSSKLHSWNIGASLGTWVASTAALSIQPGGIAANLLGVAFLTSVTALSALHVQDIIRKKGISDLENTIIEEGNNKEKNQATTLRSKETFNNKVRVGYTLGVIGVAMGGYHLVEAIAPSLGVAWVKSVLLIAAAFAGAKLGRTPYKNAVKARDARFNLAQRIA